LVACEDDLGQEKEIFGASIAYLLRVGTDFGKRNWVRARHPIGPAIGKEGERLEIERQLLGNDRLIL